MSQRRKVATLGRSLTFIVVDQTSQRCNVTTLERHEAGTSRRWNVATLARRDVAAGFSLLLLRISKKLLKTTIFTCNAHKIQKSDIGQ